MDYFCKECSSKPGWPWDETKVFQHSCQRCFRNVPCNDYAWRKPKVNQGPAPRTKDMIADNINTHAQVDLPRPKGTPAPAPIPVYPVEPPKVDHSGPVHFETVPASPDTRNDTDKALDALQPNRPGVKLKATTKDGKELPTARHTPPSSAKPEPKFEVAEDVKAK